MQQLNMDPAVFYYPVHIAPVVLIKPKRRNFKAEYQAFLLKQIAFDFEAFYEDLMATPEDEEVTWTLVDVVEICEYMINYHLHKLKDGRCSSKTRHEFALWVSSPSQAIFSFEHCCAITGRDPEALRTGFRERYFRNGFRRLNTNQRAE